MLTVPRATTMDSHGASASVVESLVNEVEGFLSKGMLKPVMETKKASHMRATCSITVTKHGQVTENLSIENIEEKFREERGMRRITIPNVEILQYHTAFPAHNTTADVLESLGQEYQDMIAERDTNLAELENTIQTELSLLDSQGEDQSIENILKKISSLVNKKHIILPLENKTVRINVVQEIKHVMKSNPKDKQTEEIIKTLGQTLNKSIIKFIREKNPKTKKQLGAFINRHGQLAENEVAFAVSRALEDYTGITLSGFKTKTFLSPLISGVGILQDTQPSKNSAMQEVEHDHVASWLEANTIVINFIQTKTDVLLPWSEQSTGDFSKKKSVLQAKEAFFQLVKDFKTFKQIFPDLSTADFKMIRFQYFSALPFVSCHDWPGLDCTEHILFKEDIEDSHLLKTKLKLPNVPPAIDTISPEIERLHVIISARYAGVASLVGFKMPEDGMLRQKKELKDVRNAYIAKEDKVYMLTQEQQNVFNSRINSFCNFGGHGTGKTVLNSALFCRKAKEVATLPVEDRNHLLIACIWQHGANALLQEYKDLAETLPKVSGLELKVVTMEELLKMFWVTNEAIPTTYLINAVCKNASKIEKARHVYLAIDEVWISVPKVIQPHLTKDDPNSIVGHIPFVKDGVLYSWSLLDPGDVQLIVAVMPDCQHLLNKDQITAQPPVPGLVYTAYLTKSLRTGMRIHWLVQHLSTRVETHLRVWRYLLPPRDERDGHQVMGSLPIWQTVVSTSHILCEKVDCTDCFLRTNLQSLRLLVNEAIDTHGADTSNMVFILFQPKEKESYNAVDVLGFLGEEFPGVSVRFEDEFEGMECSSVFCLVNGSFGDCPYVLPLALTRANNHLVVMCQDFRGIMQEAVDHKPSLLGKKGMSGNGIEQDDEGLPNIGVTEAVQVLINMSNSLEPDTLQLLAGAWGVGDEEFRKQVAEGRSRFLIMEYMLHSYQAGLPEITLNDILNSLACVTSTNLGQRVRDKMQSNLDKMMKELQDRIENMYLTPDLMVELAHRVGQRQLFTSLTRPSDFQNKAVTDSIALVNCLAVWHASTQNQLTSEDLFTCLRKTGLNDLVEEMKEMLEDSDLMTERSMNIRERVQATTIDVFFPALTIIFTLIFLCLLFVSQGLKDQFVALTIMLWIPAAPTLAFHIHSNKNFYSPVLGKGAMTLMLIFVPLAQSAIKLQYTYLKTGFHGQTMARFYMQRLLHLTKSVAMINNFTSFAIIVLILHLLNEQRFSSSGLLFSISIITGLLHLFSLSLNLVLELRMKVSSLYILTWTTISTLVIQISSTTVLLSCDTSAYLIILVIATMLLILLATNLVVMNRRPISMEEGEQSTWIKSIPLLSMPLTPAPGIQLIWANLIFTVPCCSFVISNGFTNTSIITENITKMIFCNNLFFTVVSSIFHHTLFRQAQSGNEEIEDLEEPLIDGNEDRIETKSSKVCQLLLPIHLCLSTAISIALFIFVFNSCPTIPQPKNGQITCSSPSTYMISCLLSCKPTYLSISSLESSCTWRGVWTEPQWNNPLQSCRPQEAVMVAMNNLDNETGIIHADTLSFPHLNNFTYPKVPYFVDIDNDGRLYMAYVNGRLVLCGLQGDGIRCWSLKSFSGQKEWHIEDLLIKTVFGASTAVVENGKTMWVLGGVIFFKTGEEQVSIQEVRPGQDTVISEVKMTDTINLHCSTTLWDGSVMVVGGMRGFPPYSWSSISEIWNFTTKSWSAHIHTRVPLWHPSCSQIFVRQDPDCPFVVEPYPDNGGILTAVVSGSYLVQIYLPWTNTWEDLLPLPNMEANFSMFSTHLFLMPPEPFSELTLLGGRFITPPSKHGRHLQESAEIWRMVSGLANSSKIYWDDMNKSLDFTPKPSASVVAGVPDMFWLGPEE